MKRKWIVSFLLLFFIILNIHPVFAVLEVMRFRISVSNPVIGEKASYTLELSPLTTPVDQEQWITVIFPEEIIIPSEIMNEDVLINQSQHPLDIIIYQNHHIQLLIPKTQEDHLMIAFDKSAQFRNPLHNNPVTVSLVWEKRSMMLTSEEIQFINPANSIKSSFSEAPYQPGLYHKPVTMSLYSEVADEIKLSVNGLEEKSYDKPIQFLQGSYHIRIYGIRSTGAKEDQIEIRFVVDHKAPVVKMISPKENFITNQVKTMLVFSIQDQTSVSLSILGKTFAIRHTGKPVELEVAVLLSNGENKFTWKASDEVGLTVSGSIVINLDTTPPALQIYSPRKGDIVCADRVEITGKSEPGSRLFLGDQTIPLDLFGNFSLLLVPEKGKNVLQFRCFDPAGNETAVQVDFEFYTGKWVELWIGKDVAKVEGKELSINPPPVMDPETGEVYIPLRFIPSILDYKLEWNSKESFALLTRKQVQILIKPNDSKVRIKTGNSTDSIVLVQPPKIISNVLMIPSDFLKKVLGAECLFAEEQKRLFINFCDRSE